MKYKEKLYTLKGLSCKYGDKEILDSIFFDLYQRKSLVIVGPGGSGKSTLLNILCNTDLSHFDIESNSSFILTEKYRVAYLRQKESYLQPNFKQIFAAKALDIEHHIKKIIESEEMHRQLLRHADTDLKRVPKQLFKLFEIALFVSLSSTADILILDEPEVNLEGNLPVLEQVIKSQMKSKTVIIATHNMELTRNVADHVLYLSYGSIIEYSKNEDFHKSKKPEVQHLIKLGA